MAMITMLKNARVYAPEALGIRDLWVAGERIIAMESSLPEPPQALTSEVIDLSGAALIPGLIDAHVHVTGGGGEDGPATRVPRLGLSRLTRAGVTSVVGVLGTDGTTRTIRDLVATTLGLRDQGLNAWCYTGSYEIPPITLTGSVRDDIVFVDPIIGVGELAISDHRSSQPTLDELARVAADAHVAGLISGKSGVVHVHMGDGRRGFELLRRLLDETELPPSLFHPTHVNRQRWLFEQAPELAKRGMTVDVTAFPGDDESYSAPEALDRWLHAGHPVNRITCSSDGAGCLPVFGDDGRVCAMDIGQPMAVVETMQALSEAGHALDTILPFFTTNVATVTGLSSKGRIAASSEADLVILDDDISVQSVMCRGRWLVRDEEVVVPGTFEKLV